MGRLSAFVALGLIFCCVVEHVNGVYFVSIPKVFRPGMDLNIYVHVVNPAGQVTVNAKLHNIVSPNVNEASLTLQKEKVVTSGVPTTISIAVPGVVPNGPFNLTVSGTGSGMTFLNTTEIAMEKRSMSILIQTDKAMYKPGQKVNMRLLAISPDLKPVIKEYTITIVDSNGNKIQRWAVPANTSSLGVITKSLQLSQQPPLGDWKIQATVDGQMADKNFTVDKYVLPRFEVTVDAGGYLLTTDKTITGRITAKYTYGKPVQGFVTLLIDFNGQRISETLEINGERDFSVSLDPIGNFYSGSNFVVLASVTEALSGTTLNGSATLPVHDSRVEIIILESTPTAFKAGLPFIVNLRVQEPDGKTVRQQDQQGHVVKLVAQYYSLTSGTLSDTKSIPADGLLSFELNIPDAATSLSIQVYYDDQTSSKAYKSISQFRSFSKQGIQVEVLTDSVQAGSPVSFKVEASQTIQIVAYQIIARGSIVLSGEVDVSGTSATFQITSSAEMAPGAWIVVYFIRTDDEVIADSKPFTVQGVFKNQVGINFSADKKKASEPVDLTVSADPNSFVGILVVDKSVQLLKSGYDIDKEEVLTELARWDLSKHSSGSGGGGDPMPFRGWFPYVPDADSTGSIFKDAGLLVMSDAYFAEPQQFFHNYYYYSDYDYAAIMDYDGDAVKISPRTTTPLSPVTHVRKFFPETWLWSDAVVEEFDDDVEFDLPVMAMNENAGAVPPQTTAPLSPVTHIRKFFPETWLWSDAVVDDAGSVTFQATVPDTITSWRATAFALNMESGFGVVDNAAELLAFQSFFVTLNMPYSIIRGEEFAVQALIFNYENDDLQTTVTLAESNDFKVREDVTTFDAPVKKRLQTVVTVPRQGSILVSFWIVTENLGQITVRVDAQTTVGFADAVSRKLLVEPEGKPIYGSTGYFVNLNEGTFSQAFSVPFPTVGVVDGSQRVKVSIIGDIMGPALTGLDRFLRVPTGCGEQNMIGLVPNIFITKYLIAMNAMTAEIRDKAEANMAIGYQRELTYQHKDSSFSAFGESDASGSTWLTAFVLKSFKQAKLYVYVDDEILAATANWLVGQQVTSGSDAGSFKEPGKLCHKDMQGGVNSKQTITAYVLVSFLEERDRQNTPVEQAITKGFDYLVSKMSTLNKPYDVAVVTYAFAKYMEAGTATKYRDAFNSLLQKLDSMAVKKGGETHWTASDSNAADVQADRYSYRTPSNDIETTSYALLTYNTLMGTRVADSMAVVKWLQTQRNSFGGYGSTQDTVIGLQALAEFAMSFQSAGSQNVMAVVSSSGSFSHAFDTITSDNSILTYNVDVPAQETSLTLSASGSGVAMMMVSWQYNIDNSGTGNSISITVNDLSGEDLDILKVEFCVRWLEQEVSGMVVTEFGIPSGYVADLDAIKKPSTVKRMELDDRTVNIYFDEVTNSQTCIQMVSQRLMAVSGVKPSVVTAYSYYQIEKSAEAFYLPSSLGAANPCQVCGADCEGCPAFINKFPQAGAAPQRHGSYVTLFLSVCICVLAGVITAV